MNKLLVISICVLLLSCGKDDIYSTNQNREIEKWLDSNNITAKKDDNDIYYYPEITNITGSVVNAGSVVAIYYNLYDLDANLIASHQRTDGDALIFKHGVSAVYPVGLGTGIAYMRLGETFSFILPKSQAFAGLTSNAINANKIVRMQVELINVMEENSLFDREITNINNYIVANNLNNTIIRPLDPVRQFGSGLAYKRVVAGQGELPSNGDTIVVNYTATFVDGSRLSTTEGFKWIYGANNPRALIRGIDFGVSMMQEGENALLIIPSSQAYRESVLVIPEFIRSDLVSSADIPSYALHVPPYSTLIFDITRID